jgi:ribosomal protein S3
MMLDQKVRDVAKKIGNFYLLKNNGDYAKTEEEINSLQISKIEVTDDTVAITTNRPGLLIGRRGTNVDMLTEALKMKIKIIEEEDAIINWLVPQEQIDEFAGDWRDS